MGVTATRNHRPARPAHTHETSHTVKLTDAQLKKVMPDKIGPWGPVDGQESNCRKLHSLADLPAAVRTALVKARHEMEKTPISEDDDSQTYGFDDFYEVHAGKKGVIGYAVVGSNGSDPEYVCGMVSVVNTAGKAVYDDTDVNAD